jgi:hypothetical protein
MCICLMYMYMCTCRVYVCMCVRVYVCISFYRSGRRGGDNDQWEAWKEIQMQQSTMSQLEGQLQAVCYAMDINPMQIIMAIDASL